MSGSPSNISDNDLTKGIIRETTKPFAKKLKERNNATQGTINGIIKVPLASGTAAVESSTIAINDAESTLSSMAAAAPAPSVALVKPDRKLAHVSDWLKKSSIDSQAKIDTRLPKIEEDQLTIQSGHGSKRGG